MVFIKIYPAPNAYFHRLRAAPARGFLLKRINAAPSHMNVSGFFRRERANEKLWWLPMAQALEPTPYNPTVM